MSEKLKLIYETDIEGLGSSIKEIYEMDLNNKNANPATIMNSIMLFIKRNLPHLFDVNIDINKSNEQHRCECGEGTENPYTVENIVKENQLAKEKEDFISELESDEEFAKYLVVLYNDNPDNSISIRQITNEVELFDLIKVVPKLVNYLFVLYKEDIGEDIN